MSECSVNGTDMGKTDRQTDRWMVVMCKWHPKGRRLLTNMVQETRNSSSSSHMRVINHNWSARKQRPHPQSVAEISHHSVLSGDRIRQCETSSGSRHKDTDHCL